MAWEQPLPIKLKHKTPMRPFGELRMAVREKSRYQSLFKNPELSPIMKVCSTWREEQFARAIAKRSTKMAAQAALNCAVRQQRMVHGVVPQAI